MNSLVVYDAMILAIDQCYKIDEVKDIRDKALALEEYARQACNLQAERKAAEIRIRAERKAGQLLAEIERSRGGDRKSDQRVTAQPFDSETPFQQKKRQANISDYQATRWQQLAALPHGDFEGRLHDPLVAVPTTTGILDPDRPKAPPDHVLHLWGIFRGLERDGYLSEDINDVIGEMTAKMRQEMARLIPQIQTWINNYNG